MEVGITVVLCRRTGVMVVVVVVAAVVVLYVPIEHSDSITYSSSRGNSSDDGHRNLDHTNV